MYMFIYCNICIYGIWLHFTSALKHSGLQTVEVHDNNICMQIYEINFKSRVFNQIVKKKRFYPSMVFEVYVKCLYVCMLLLAVHRKNGRYLGNRMQPLSSYLNSETLINLGRKKYFSYFSLLTSSISKTNCSSTGSIVGTEC